MEFTEFHNWIYKEFNINLNAYKPEQLNRRISSLMSRLGIASLDDYKKVLMVNKEQRERFLDFITINVTEFFRNPELFYELQGVIREYCKEKSRLKIWSAACSMGCEPYSIAILINDMNLNIKADILATDIDKNILKKAEAGEYLSVEMKNVSEGFKRKYFNISNDRYIIDQKIKSMVTFKKHDLILDSYDNNFDLIVCRNVIIYFRNDIKNEIFKKFCNSLKKGGMLFVGATESIYSYKDFNLEKVSTFIYKKV
ncbi:protein-glutamate O-methyltransferase CheR [Clostridium sp. AL.422]|uniref:CheR family methyltransferase n=1 Tax=Clostridium TaxID=1485 RepID=UPI00293DB9C5|nr:MULTISPECIES: protein-glutamate O-methyltransferase CheR [unclassified Clostridium]MDV4149735.1 protein-glutamate O-methyltransferase CheR [Clostridium sp. AL.422]